MSQLVLMGAIKGTYPEIKEKRLSPSTPPLPHWRTSCWPPFTGYFLWAFRKQNSSYSCTIDFLRILPPILDLILFFNFNFLYNNLLNFDFCSYTQTQNKEMLQFFLVFSSPKIRKTPRGTIAFLLN